MLIDVFINAPQHLRLTRATRFWNASGFSIQLGAGGASLNVESLISLLQGGVSFDTVGSDTTPVEAGHLYELYPSETAARQNLIGDAPGARLMLTAYFEGTRPRPRTRRLGRVPRHPGRRGHRASRRRSSRRDGQQRGHAAGDPLGRATAPGDLGGGGTRTWSARRST